MRIRIDSRQLHIALLIILGVLVYSNTFSSPFMWDDQGLIAGNPVVRNLNFFSAPDKAAVYPEYAALRTRYIGFLTIALNYRFHGLDVWGYHAVNLAIHIATALLVWWLVLLTFRTPFMRGSPLAEKAPVVALIAGTLFTVHPVQTEAVTYIMQRLASLATLFYLLSLVCFIKFRLSASKKRKWAFYALSLLAATLGMKTKEIAFTLPLAVALYEWAFLEGGTRKRAALLLPFFITMLIVPLTHLMLSGGDVVQAATAKAAPSIPRHVYLMTEFRVLVTYLRLLILPVNQNLYFDHPFYDSLLSPHVLIPLLFHLAVVVGGAYLWIKSRVGEPALRLAAFGVFWFYLGLAVESTFVPLHPIYEHRLYLPMAGLSVVAALVAVMLLERVRRPRARYAIALSYVGILLVFMSLTLARNTVWQSEISLWEDTASKSPLKDKVIDNLGMAFEREGRHQSAIEMFKSAISLKPDYAEPYNHLGPIYARRGMLRDAETMFKKAIELKPGFSDAHNNLGVLYETRGMFDKALFHYQKAAELSPNLAQVHYNMGILYDKMGKKNLAVNEFQLALRIDPGHARARQYLYRIRR